MAKKEKEQDVNIQTLLSRYIENDLSDKELRLFKKRLRKDPELRRNLETHNFLVKNSPGKHKFSAEQIAQAKSELFKKLGFRICNN